MKYLELKATGKHWAWYPKTSPYQMWDWKGQFKELSQPLAVFKDSASWGHVQPEGYTTDQLPVFVRVRLYE